MTLDRQSIFGLFVTLFSIGIGAVLNVISADQKLAPAVLFGGVAVSILSAIGGLSLLLIPRKKAMSKNDDRSFGIRIVNTKGVTMDNVSVNGRFDSALDIEGSTNIKAKDLQIGRPTSEAQPEPSSKRSKIFRGWRPEDE